MARQLGLQRDLNFTVNRGDIFIIMGGSGCGRAPASAPGACRPPRRASPIRGRGLLGIGTGRGGRGSCGGSASLPGGALGSSMTLAQNVAPPAGGVHRPGPGERPGARVSQAGAGGPFGFEEYYPSEISGG